MQTYPLQLMSYSPGYAQYIFVLLVKGQKLFSFIEKMYFPKLTA